MWLIHRSVLVDLHSHVCLSHVIPRGAYEHVRKHMLWLVPSRVNGDFHGKYWHFSHENIRGTMHGMTHVCEITVELYCIYST